MSNYYYYYYYCKNSSWMLTRRFKALSKKHSVQQQLIKHFQNPLVITKKKKIHWSFFLAVSLILTVCTDVMLITIYCTRMARKRCSFNESIIYYKASNLNKCMAVPGCVCVRDGERGRQGGREADSDSEETDPPVNANKVVAQSNIIVLL